MNQTADRHGFMVVYPEGIGSRIGNFHTSNAGKCCGRAMREDIDDIGFIEQLIQFIAKNYEVDVRRVYATGHSNGGRMSYRLACALSEHITAIAANAGKELQSNCKLERKVPVLHFYGTGDSCSNYDGGKQCGGCFQEFLQNVGLPLESGTFECASVREIVKLWTTYNECKERPVQYLQKGPMTCFRWSGWKTP